MSKSAVSRLNQAKALLRQGRLLEAEELLRKVLAARPGDAAALYQLAQLKTDAGALVEAHFFASSAVESDPASPRAYALLGRIQAESGSLQDALVSYDRALVLAPNDAEILFGRGAALQRLGRLEEALDSYAEAATAAPGQAEVWCNHGNALFALKRYAEALQSFERALQLKPDVSLLHFNRANTLHALGRVTDALLAYDQALAREPDRIDMRNNRGNARLEAGDIPGAIDDFRKMTVTAPADARGYNGLGMALQDRAEFAEAAKLYERAVALAPEFADARHNLALARLYQRDFSRAWLDYEHRCDDAGYRANLRKDPGSVDLFERLPRWAGPQEKISGPIGIWSEQGIGDQILFSTLLPDLMATGQPFVYEVDGRLLPAYRRAFPGVCFAAMADPPCAALTGAGAALFAGSLPGLFRPSVESFSRQPRNVLKAAPDRVGHYRDRLGRDFKVAVSWRSVREGRLGRVKSASLADFISLLDVPGVQFVDVQYGDTAADRAALGAGRRLAHFDDVNYYQNLEEVLAMIEACDLVITTSNANAHFAGALGKPVWLLYPEERAPFHYWAHRGDHRCLWYPSVEIISGPELAQWPQLVAHAAERLCGLVSAGAD